MMLFFLLAISRTSGEAHFQDNWTVTYKDVGADEYELVMEWDHVAAHYPVVTSGVYAAGSKTKWKSGVCSEDSTKMAPDGKPYWMPRFHSRPVPAEVSEKTGVKFASVDWTPCGHKDIVICHAESHYDFHLYYVEKEELETMHCDGAKPMCPYDNAHNNDVHLESEKNQRFWKFMKGNKPIFSDRDGEPRENFNYCVDPTSAIPQSGVHYGDKKETLQEWKAPVTIMGSYDCKLTFFEPMFSWKWVNGRISRWQTTWPKWESGELTYDEKAYHPLPTSWGVEVSHTCSLLGRDGIKRDDKMDPCHIKLTVRGKRCGKDLGIDCTHPPQTCAQATNCLNGKPLGFMPEFQPKPETPAPVAGPTDAPIVTECTGKRKRKCKGACTYLNGDCVPTSSICGGQRKLKFNKGVKKYKKTKQDSACKCQESCVVDDGEDRYFVYNTKNQKCFCMKGSVKSTKQSGKVHSGRAESM